MCCHNCEINNYGARRAWKNRFLAVHVSVLSSYDLIPNCPDHDCFSDSVNPHAWELCWLSLEDVFHPNSPFPFSVRLFIRPPPPIFNYPRHLPPTPTPHPSVPCSCCHFGDRSRSAHECVCWRLILVRPRRGGRGRGSGPGNDASPERPRGSGEEAYCPGEHKCALLCLSN